MGILAAITAAMEATKAFFGWKTQKEINRPVEQKRQEIQTARTEHEKNDSNIDAWVDAGRVSNESKNKTDRGNLK